MGFRCGTGEGRPIDVGCAYGLDLLAVWHVNLDGGRGGVRCWCFLEEMTGGASVCYGGEREVWDESVNNGIDYFRIGGVDTPPLMSSGAGFVDLTATHSVGTCGIILVASGFVLAGGPGVLVSNTVAMCPTVVAFVASSSWAPGLSLA